MSESKGVGRTRRQVLAGIGATPLVVAGARHGLAAPAQEATVTVSDQVVGPGLQTFGLNSAHYMPGSNTSAWLEYARIDSFRVFMEPSWWISADDIDDGADISDVDTFDSAKAELRADPEGSRFISWDPILEAYENKVHEPTNFYTVNYLFEEANRLGLDVLAEMDFKNKPPEVYLQEQPWEFSWPTLWRNWQRLYAQAYYLAKNFQTRRFAFFNEPDVPGYEEQLPSIEHYLRAMRISSDAIRCGVEEAGTAIGESLTAIVHAPVITRSTMSSSHSGHPPDGAFAGEQNIELNQATDGYYANDPRDDEIGWGRSAMENIRTDYHDEIVDYDVFDVWDTHSYMREPDYYPGEIDTIRQKLDEYTPNDTDLPIMYTELNRYNNWGFGQASETIDTPGIAREICAIGANCTTSEVDGLLFFKHAGALDADGEIQGNGFYYVDNTEEPYDVRGASRSAEALRLFAKAMVGDVARLNTAVEGTPEDLSVWSSYDESAHRYRILCLKHFSPSLDYELDLSALDYSADAQVTIEEVSSVYYGGISDSIGIPESGRLALSQPQWSLWLLTIPDSSTQGSDSRRSVQTVASHNALVRSDADADTPLGTSEGLAVERVQGGHEVTCLRFDLTDVAVADLARATLEVHASVSDGSDSCTVSVFAMPDWNWTESDLTWNSAPHLAQSDSRLDGAGNNWLPAGQLTARGSLGTCSIDVTDVISQLSDPSSITFMIINQLRFTDDEEDGNRQGRVEILTNDEEATEQRPRLRVSTSAV